jgi:hypothetical protein
MNDDPLAKFRKEAKTKEKPAEPTENREDTNNTNNPKKGRDTLPFYEAFKAQDKNRRLDILRVNGANHSPAYAYLINIIWDGDEYGAAMVLEYSTMQVRIKGKNLQPIVAAIKKSTCSFIQDYDPQCFLPPQPNEPMIESIEIVARGEKNSEGGDE